MRVHSPISTNDHSPFKAWELIVYCGEIYEVIDNLGDNGYVKRVAHDEIIHFKWDAYGEKCTRYIQQGIGWNVDKCIIVWNEENSKYKRHFSHFDKDGVCWVFKKGRTSFTSTQVQSFRFYSEVCK